MIEFNVRFGDPEAQVVIPMIAGDLAPRLAAAADGALDPAPLAFRPETHVGVVLASRGYPASGPIGVPIAGLPAAARAGRRARVSCRAPRIREGPSSRPAAGFSPSSAAAPSYEEAIERAYAGVSKIRFDGMHYRRDIGAKG